MRWHCGVLARCLLACRAPRSVFTAAARFSKGETRFCRSGEQAKEECWRRCVPQKLQTSYLLCLGSPWTADQRQARDMKATSSFLISERFPIPFVSTLSVSPYRLQPFSSPIPSHPLSCSLAFSPPLSSVPINKIWKAPSHWWLIDVCKYFLLQRSDALCLYVTEFKFNISEVVHSCRKKQIFQL